MEPILKIRILQDIYIDLECTHMDSAGSTYGNSLIRMDPAGSIYWSPSHTLQDPYNGAHLYRSCMIHMHIDPYAFMHIDPAGSIYWSVFVHMDPAGS